MKMMFRVAVALAALAVGTTARAQTFRPRVGPMSHAHPPAGIERTAWHHGGWDDRDDWRGRDRWSVSAGFWPDYYYGYSPACYSYAPAVGYADYDYGYDNGYGYDDGYGYARPSYATNGLWLGALTGAILGNNTGSLGHNAWRGAAWGAGLGWLLGTVADVNRSRAVSAPTVAAQPAPVTTAAPAPQPAPATVATPPVAATPMSAANALFGR